MTTTDLTFTSTANIATAPKWPIARGDVVLFIIAFPPEVVDARKPLRILRERPTA